MLVIKYTGTMNKKMITLKTAIWMIAEAVLLYFSLSVRAVRNVARRFPAVVARKTIMSSMKMKTGPAEISVRSEAIGAISVEESRKISTRINPPTEPPTPAARIFRRKVANEILAGPICVCSSGIIFAYLF